MIDILKQLISIPSHSGDEVEIATYIADYVTRYSNNHNVNRYAYNSGGGENVVAISKTQKIIIDIHLDTVPPNSLSLWGVSPYTLDIVNDRVVGLGSVDVKCNIAIALHMIKNRKADDITFIFCGSEETTAKGIHDVFFRKLITKVSPVIVMEPTDNLVCIGHKGALGITLNAIGVSAHASRPGLGSNAIESAILGINIFKEMFGGFAKSDPLYEETIYNIGTIHGGTTTNIVPDSCTVGIDMRLLPSQSRKQVDIFIEEFKNRLSENISLSYDFFAPSHYLGGDEILDALAGVKARCVCPFWSHAGVYSENGFPVVIYGPGSINQAHTVDEYVLLSEIQKTHDRLSKLI
jgi:acetylornithine deacetylase/succinyl-diaminopimelate desuccinylase-like protein